MPTAVLKEFTPEEVINYVNQGADEWRERWNVVKGWRDLRYMRDNVRDLIPDALRATNYEYHDGTFNKACFELASFLSAAAPAFTVNAPTNAGKAKANDIEDVLTELFGPGGLLDVESNNQVPFLVWENQGENGHGIYKLVLKRDYPLSMPQRLFADEKSDDGEYEDNPTYAPRTAKADRADRQASKYRETDGSLTKRRDEYVNEGCAWQWMHVDARVFFEFTQNGVPIMQGELVQRPATLLDQHGLPELRRDPKFIYMGEAHSQESPGTTAARVQMVNFFELWTAAWGYCGFLSATADSKGARRVVLSKSDTDFRWVNPMQRLPYFQAFGLPSTEDDTAGHLHGSFDSLIIETKLLNYLETLHFNAGHRQQLPLYQPVRDGAYTANAVPLNAEQQQLVTEDKIEEVDLPPGWKWEPISAGSEVSVFQQLEACRQRIEKNALAAVLTGTSPGAGDSGAKISLLLNAATRAMSPLVRNHETPFAQMASTVLETSKRLKIPIIVEKVEVGADGRSTVKKMSLQPSDIITTKVHCKFNIMLPVDQAALETRGMGLRASGNMSYETAAPLFFGVNDPEKERLRITRDKYRNPTEQLAWNLAMKELAADAPEIFADMIGNIVPPPPPTETVGGGPDGAYGGASAELGRGTMGLDGGGGQIDNNMTPRPQRVTS